MAEVRVLQANQHTSSIRRTATEAGGGTVQSPRAEQGRVRDYRLHDRGASTWMVRAAPNSILGRGLSRDRRDQSKNDNEENGGESVEPEKSTGVQSRVTPLTKSREGNYKQHMANFFERLTLRRTSLAVPGLYPSARTHTR